MWDERYDTEDYVYGKEPNDFIVTAFENIPPGRVLCLAAGEGRNAVYLARQGHEVVAVDSSAVGLKKTRALAEEHSVIVETVCADLADFEIESEAYDAITMIFFHIPPPHRGQLLKRAARGLRPGGHFVLEAFTPRQLSYNTGGPKDHHLLMELDDVKRELKGLELSHAVELVREFKEGLFHAGPGSVIQIIAVKSGRI